VQIIDGDKLKEWLYTNQSDYYDVINDRTYIRDHIDEIGCGLDKIELNDNEYLVVRYPFGYIPIKSLSNIMELLKNKISNTCVAIPKEIDLENGNLDTLIQIRDWLNKEIENRKVQRNKK